MDPSVDGGPNRTPRAEAGPDQAIECTGNLSATAQLDGSQSTDPGSRPGTNDDIVSFEWSENGVLIASGEATSVSLRLGVHDIALKVTDEAGAASTDSTIISILDTMPSLGGITSPVSGQCFGPGAVPVTVVDTFNDVCDPAVLRTYSPPPGPQYSDHGDYHVVVSASDTSGNTTTASVEFTIGTVPPVVQLLSPPHGVVLPGALPFDILFEDSDDDGATGGLVHEVVKLQGCPIHDGATYGDKDGLLSDETLQLGLSELCRIAAQRGFGELRNPELRVEATDCGGNVGIASLTLPGSIRLLGGVCGQARPTPVRSNVGTRLGAAPGQKATLAPR